MQGCVKAVITEEFRSLLFFFSSRFTKVTLLLELVSERRQEDFAAKNTFIYIRALISYRYTRALCVLYTHQENKVKKENHSSGAVQIRCVFVYVNLSEAQ